GTSSMGTITVGANGGFEVSGSHTYSASNDWFGFVGFGDGQNYAVNVSITDTKTQDQATAEGLVAVTDAAPSLSVVAENITHTIPAPLRHALAASPAPVTPNDTSPSAGHFTATIDWGDGTTSTGTITVGADGGFDVSGSHTYDDGNGPGSGWGPRFAGEHHFPF